MENPNDTEMVTPRQYSEMHNVSYGTVMVWLRRELLDGAVKVSLPFGENQFVYNIPKNTLPPQMKPGPKPKKLLTVETKDDSKSLTPDSDAT